MSLKPSIVYEVNPPREDYEQCVQMFWKVANGDYQVYLKAFPNNFWLTAAKDKESGKVVGSIMLSTMWTLDGEEISTFCGFFVHPDYRNRGIGNTLFRMAIEPKLKAGKNVNMNAMNDKTSWYVARGFKHFAPTPNTTFSVNTENVKKLKPVTTDNTRIVGVEHVSDQMLIDYDKSVVPVDRSCFIPLWLRRNDVFTRVAVDSEGRVCGFACLRMIAGDRLLYSPIFAKNKDIAEALVLATIEAVPNIENFTEVFFVASGENLAIEEIVDRLSQGRFHKKTHVHRMFSDKVLHGDDAQIFGITSHGCCCV